MKAISAQLPDAGITIKQDQLEYGAYLEKARAAKEEGATVGWQINMHDGNRYNDIDGYLAEYHTEGGRNYGHWGGADFDQKIDAQAQIADLKERVAAVHDLVRIMGDEGWTPGTVAPVYMNVYNAKLQNFGDAPEWYTGTRSFIDAWFGE